MKYLLATIFTFTVLAASAQGKRSKPKTVEIQTSAICEMCQMTIEEDLTFEKGVRTVELNLDNKVVTVVFNDKRTNPDKIRKRISKLGYHADDIARDPKAYENLPMCCKDGAHGMEH